MNKRTVAVSILMLMMCATAVSVFAAEANYQVVVVFDSRAVRDRSTNQYIQRPERRTVTIIVTATSVDEAERRAVERVRAQRNDFGRLISANAVRM